MGAAEEARSILSHCDYLANRDYQTRKVGKSCFVTGLCAVKNWWDPTAWVKVPNFVDDGQGGMVIDQTKPTILQQKGENAEEIVPLWELLMDPQAREYCEMGYVGHQKVRSYDYLTTRYEDGYMCRPDVGRGSSASTESRKAAVTGEYVRGSEPGPSPHDHTVVNEMWYAPYDDGVERTEAEQFKDFVFPNGALITIANGILLRAEAEWPNMDAKELLSQGVRFPFAFMVYEEQLGSLYPLSAVQDVIPVQRSINNTASRMEEARNTSYGKLLYETGSIPINSWDDARPNEKIPVDPAFSQRPDLPKHIPGAGPEAWMQQMIMIDRQFVDDIMGQHETTDGKVPGGVDSGVAIQSLQLQDDLVNAEFSSNVEHFHHQRGILNIHICGKNYSDQRLLNVSQGYFGDPANKMGSASAQPAQPPVAPLAPPMAPNMPPQGMQPPTVPPAGQSTMPMPGGMPQGAQQPPMPGSAPVATGGQSTQQAPPAPTPTPESKQDDAAFQVKAFKHLRNGGCAHLFIVPGSSQYEDPQRQRDFILQMIKLGVLGVPGTASFNEAVLKLLEFAQVDELIPMIRRSIEEAALMQALQSPNPQSEQQAKAASEQQLLDMKLQHEQQLEVMRDQHAQNKMQVEQQFEAWKSQNEAALKQQMELQKQQMEFQVQQQQQQANQLHDLKLEIFKALKIEQRLTGAMDPIAIAGEEAAMGLPTPTDEQLQKMMKNITDPLVAPAQGAANPSSGANKSKGQS